MNEKYFWADNLRAIATISVILLHVSSPVLYLYNSIPLTDWWLGNLLNSISRFCVPIFFMLTGALLLPIKHELGNFFKKRITRILYPFIFWSIIYVVYNITNEWNLENKMSSIDIIRYAYGQLKNGASIHLWYVYTIIGIYMIFPIISKWIANSTQKEILYYLVVWFAITLVNLSFFKIYKPNIDLRYFSGCLGYPILGYYLVRENEYYRNKLWSSLMFILGTLATMVGTFLLTWRKGQFEDEFYSFLSPNVIVLSTGVFLLILNMNCRIGFIKRVINLISKYSYGIYLSHILVIYLLQTAGISWSFLTPIIGIPLTTIACLAISLSITYMLNKIPFGKYISG